MITDVTHHTIHAHPEHCVNQIATRVLRSGELGAVFNEERFPFHHDSGRTLLMRSTDGGATWQPDPPKVVLDWSDTTGNWDCGICELADGRLLVNLTITAAPLFRPRSRSIPPRSPAATTCGGAITLPAGRLMLPLCDIPAYERVFVVHSSDRGKSWGTPVLAATLPDRLFEEPCALLLPDGCILMLLRENRSRRLWQVISTDAGATWSEPAPTRSPATPLTSSCSRTVASSAPTATASPTSPSARSPAATRSTGTWSRLWSSAANYPTGTSAIRPRCPTRTAASPRSTTPRTRTASPASTAPPSASQGERHTGTSTWRAWHCLRPAEPSS